MIINVLTRCNHFLCLTAIGRLANDVQFRVQGQEHAQSLAHHAVIVNKQHLKGIVTLSAKKDILAQKRPFSATNQQTWFTSTLQI